MPQANAYPQLIPGSQEFGHAPWTVMEVAPTNSVQASGTSALGPFTSKPRHLLRLPKPVMQHDWLARQHEMIHVSRKTAPPTGNKWHDIVIAMLEEVAVDAQSLANGVDLRPLRDAYVYDQAPPTDIYTAAIWYLQLYTSSLKSRNSGLRETFARASELLDEGDVLDHVRTAARSVWTDYSYGNVIDRANWLHAMFVKPNQAPKLPDPPVDIPALDDDDQDSLNPAADDGEEAGHAGDTDAENDDAPEEQAGDEGAPAPSGGVDGDTPADGPTQPGGTGSGPTVDINREPTTEFQDFGLDLKPSLRERREWEAGEPGARPERPDLARERDALDQEATQRQIDLERASRKAGESSRSQYLTVSTTYGNCDVHRHLLSEARTTTLAATWRARDAGPELRYPHRLIQDQQVFAARSGGGSILCDASGSMAWHAALLTETIQHHLPRLYLARYDGHQEAWTARYEHKMATHLCRYCILAKDGRAVDLEHMPEEPELSGGNCDSGADAVALAYAAKWAPRPIVWVSDGQVGSDPEYYRPCDALMRQHRIVRVITVYDAVLYLQGHAVPGWWQCATVNTQWVRRGSAVQQTPGQVPGWDRSNWGWRRSEVAEAAWRSTHRTASLVD